MHPMKLLPYIKIATFIQETALPEGMGRGLLVTWGRDYCPSGGNNLKTSLWRQIIDASTANATSIIQLIFSALSLSFHSRVRVRPQIYEQMRSNQFVCDLCEQYTMHQMMFSFFAFTNQSQSVTMITSYIKIAHQK